MPDPSRLALFVGAALLLLVVPGPSVLYIVTQSVSHGRRAGIVSVAGITTGTLVHIAAATVGTLGAARVLGARVRRGQVPRRRVPDRQSASAGSPAGSASTEPGRRDTRDLGRLYRQGIVVNTLNPKTALFFLAFLPQFVDPGRGMPWLQVLALGLLFAALGFCSDGVWALVAGTLGERLRRSRRFPAVQRYVSGSVFVGLGAVAALTAPVKQN